MNKLHIITVATNNEGYYNALNNNLHNINIITLGFGQKWNGFTMKYDLTKKYLNNLNDNDIVVFTDAYDVLLLQDSNTIINNPVTVTSNLTISGISQFQNNIIVNDIYPSYNTLNLSGNIINIGNTNSIISMIGTSNFIASTNVELTDKLLILNINASTGSGFDIGNDSGFEILGTGGTGFIKTNTDATRYQICSPNNGQVMYIAIQDSNNNLYVTGITTLNNNTVINSNLFVSGNT
jgi:hypothetical protein